MVDREKDLPANADANRSDEDVQQHHQEEYDDKSKVQLDKDARIEQAKENQQEEDSHEKQEESEKKKDTGEWDKVNRQFPGLKK